MYPHERSLVEKYKNQPFAIIGVNSDRDREKTKEVVKDERITWRSFWNGGSTRGPISTRWNVSGWPTVYVIDHKGVIRLKSVGNPGDEVLDKLIEELVAEIPSDD